LRRPGAHRDPVWLPEPGRPASRQIGRRIPVLVAGGDDSARLVLPKLQNHKVIGSATADFPDIDRVDAVGAQEPCGCPG
jgi:hypothetical protein